MLPIPVCLPCLQLVLVYCESLIIISYFYMIPQRLGCEFLSPQLQRRCGKSRQSPHPPPTLPPSLVC